MVTFFTVTLIIEAPFHFVMLWVATDFDTAYEKFAAIAEAVFE